MKRIMNYIFIILILLLVAGCYEEQLKVEIEEEIVESLDIFLVGDQVEEVYQDDTKNIFYTTMVVLGEFEGWCHVFGEQGFLFYEAFQRFEKGTGIELNLHWFQFPEDLERELGSIKPSEYPDLILMNETTKDDYYQYIKNGLFYDVTLFAEEESLYTEGKYYNVILDAGKMDGRQYILPILFNIDTIMGSTRTLNEAGMYIENAKNHSEFMDLVILGESNQKMAMPINQYNSVLTYMLPYYLYGASGEEWIDYDKEAVTLDKEKYAQMAEFHKVFMKQQYGELAEESEIDLANSKHMVYRVVEKIVSKFLPEKMEVVIVERTHFNQTGKRMKVRSVATGKKRVVLMPEAMYEAGAKGELVRKGRYGVSFIPEVEEKKKDPKQYYQKRRR